MNNKEGNPVRTGLVAAVVVFAAAFISGSVLYQRSLSAIKADVRDDLLRVARTAAVHVDGGKHGQFTNRDQEHTPSYSNAVARLEKIRQAGGDIRFVYTCVLISNVVYFVLDPTPEGDADHDGVDDKSHIMQEYKEASPELIKALQSGEAQASQEPYKDAWGQFMSGYAPFLDDSGQRAGVVGVDLDAHQYVVRLAGMRTAARAGLVVAVLLAGVAGWGFYKSQARAEEYRRRLKGFNAGLEKRVIERTAELEASRQSLQEENIERRRAETEALQAREAAEAAARAKGDFLAAMSHELRTPLNGILGSSSVLLGTPLDEDQLEFVNAIQTSGDALTRLIDDILKYSETGTSDVILESSCYNAQSVICEVAELVSVQAKQKNLRWELPTPADAPFWVMGDVGRIRHVLLNLMGNAVKFTEKGQITVQVHRRFEPAKTEPGGDAQKSGRPGTIHFEVRDTGPGITREKLAGLFDEFTQLDSSHSRRHGGSGLGLAFSKRLVELMGGQIRVESEPGRGSTFAFVLPALDCAGARGESVSAGNPAAREVRPVAQAPERNF